MPSPQPGQLILVATPIGNLSDLSFRAVEILRNADFIACEDTRHSGILCRHYGISTPLISYFREKEQQKAQHILTLLQSGKTVALISDAGTPAISDPGAILVRLAQEAGIQVISIPGPCALTLSLSLAGLKESSFYFGGFLPSTAQARKQALRELILYPCPLVFYEAPHRITASLQDMLEVLGNRQGQLFRELTKMHEEHLRGTLQELVDACQQKTKGELVLLVSGNKQSTSPRPEDLESLLRWHRHEKHNTLKEAVAGIAADLGIPRTQVYKKALSVWQEEE